MRHAAFGLPTENWARRGIVTASAEVIGLGAGNVQTDQGATSTAWQTPAGTTTAWLQVDAGAAVDWGGFGLFNANLTTAATVRWRLGSDPAFASHSYDSGTLSNTIAAGYRQSLHIPPAAQTARYTRVDIADATNPEAVLRVAHIFAGPLRRPLRNIGFGTAVQRLAETPILVTRGGQEFADFRFARRGWSLTLPSLAPSDVWPLVQELQRAAETGGNVLFIPFPASAHLPREAVFGRLASAAPIAWTTPATRTWSATITERL